MARTLKASVNAIASELANREGKRSQARIGDIREMLGQLADMVDEDYLVGQTIVDYGDHRRRERSKKKKKNCGRRSTTA